MEKISFHYQPICSAPGCQEAAVYKVAAPWSNGLSHELKNYGLACADHRESQLLIAQQHRELLKVAEEETVGSVQLYQLVPGRRDVELSKVPD